MNETSAVLGAAFGPCGETRDNGEGGTFAAGHASMSKPTQRAEPSADTTEADALAALDAGDRDRALTIMMRGYSASLYRFCRQMVGVAQADDLAQLTFVQAYQGISRFRRASSLRGWLYKIARNRCHDELRRRRRRGETDGEPPDRAADDSGVDAQLAARQVLEQCLQRLKPKAREAVLLRHNEGFTYDEMMALTGDSAATLQMRVSRALPGLRKCIEARSRR